jgi:CRP-like cAMP-binding protein
MAKSTGHRDLPRTFDKRALLLAHPFFRGLPNPIIDQIASHGVIRKAKKGAVLFRKGETGTQMYAVCKGAVRISAPSKQGKDAIFNLVRPGEIFGEIALLDGGQRTADAAAIEDSELMIIERRDFAPLMREFPELAMRLIEILCTRLRKTSEQVEDIIFLGLPNRLAKVLLQLHRQPSSNLESRKIRITQRELSQLIGASRESTNKQLRDWQRMKWLKLGRGGVVLLAIEALAGQAAEAAD